MRTDFYYDSCGIGQIHGCCWTPEGEPRAVLQIIHGIAEYVERYDDFANYLNSLGYLVVAEDHMGHGKSIGTEGTQGYFNGGWMAAMEDSYRLLTETRQKYPQLPYVLFGHSMGSFLARTLLEVHPDSGIAAAVICGTGWQPALLLRSGLLMCKLICKKDGEKNPSPTLQNLVFGSYNQRVEHPRTPFDWLNRDKRAVDAYMADPLCGFVASGGLLRDMLGGIAFIQKKENLEKMNRELPVFFIAGGDDPVGNYGKGVRQAADAFGKAGMKHVSVRVYPLCRHEILNEINKQEIYEDIARWLKPVTQE